MASAFAISSERLECDRNLLIVEWRNANLRTLNKLIEGSNRAITDPRKQNYTRFQ